MGAFGVAMVVGWTSLFTASGAQSGAAAEADPVEASAAPGASAEPARRWRVVVSGSEPFVAVERGELTGFSVEVWKQVAAEVGLDYDLLRVPSVAEAVDQVAEGRADLAIGPISITAARSERVAFTQAYFQSSLGILAKRSGGRLDKLKPFLTLAFGGGLVLLLLVLGAVGTAVWLAERRRNPDQFPPRAAAGIANGIWMALVTMTTVGYGDRVPKTGIGRALTGVWMLLSIIVTSSLVAFIASALTLSQLDRPAISTAEELRGRRVATVQGTPGAEFASARGARAQTAPDLDAAVEVLLRDGADAVVFDRPMLRHYLRTHPEVDLGVAEASYQPQGYGFAAPHESANLRAVDITLLKLHESGRITDLAERWLGP